jgi:hypothetical protein
MQYVSSSSSSVSSICVWRCWEDFLLFDILRFRLVITPAAAAVEGVVGVGVTGTDDSFSLEIDFAIGIGVFGT